MRITKIIAASTLIFATSAMAMEESENIVLKVRANYSSLQSKLSSLPAATSTAGRASAKTPGNLFASAFGGEVSGTFFFTNNIAAEFSTGISLYKAKGSAPAALDYNYNDTSKYKKKKNGYAIPTSLTMQYHIAPYGAIRPYVGAGYHYTYMLPKTSDYKLSHGSGAVLQAGVDVVLKDDTYINLDIKQYFFSTKAKFSKAFIVDASNNQITSKVKLNPLVMGLGLGIKL